MQYFHRLGNFHRALAYFGCEWNSDCAVPSAGITHFDTLVVRGTVGLFAVFVRPLQYDFGYYPKFQWAHCAFLLADIFIGLQSSI